MRLRKAGIDAAEAKRQSKLRAEEEAARAADELARKEAEEKAALERKKAETAARLREQLKRDQEAFAALQAERIARIWMCKECGNENNEIENAEQCDMCEGSKAYCEEPRVID